jgi:hypothetical protein
MRLIPFTSSRGCNVGVSWAGSLSAFVALTIAGVCLLVAAYFCHFYYTPHQSTVTALESRINSFDTRLATLEGHKSRELTPVRVWAVISTSDRPADEHVRFYLTSDKHPADFFQAINAKGGPLVRPELRLPAGSTTNCVYDIQVESQFGIVVDAWLSHAEPYQDLAAFDEFRVNSPNRTNIVRLIARPKPGASVQMRFDILVLCER